MDCPKCESTMRLVSFHGVAAERCTKCAGLWLAARAHEKLARMEGSEALDSGDAEVGKGYDKQGRIRCPVCRSPLVRMVDSRQPHVWFESCAACGGVFFDAGEFKDLKEHTLADFFRDLFAKERR